jgi:hypothetical protein
MDDVRENLEAHLPPALVHELFEAHAEAKRSFYLGGLRLAEVEGGRFCEAVFRVLEHVTTGIFTPLGKSIKTDKIIEKLANLPGGSHPDAVRLHIPRALRVVYDIRNNRDAAHLGDGINPNLQDATLVATVLDWVLAELVRLYHSVSANEAQAIVETIVTRKAPAVEEFGGFLKALNPKLGVSDLVLLLLYQRGKTGALFSELDGWVRPSMRSNLRRTLQRLVHNHAYVHLDGERYVLTRAGYIVVEKRRLYAVPEP